jgi:hypothetical protein
MRCLLHSGPLGLAHHLLYVELLPFGSISSEDCELMQLKTVSESSPRTQTPFFGNFTIYFSPRVKLMHLTTNAILLVLCVTGQEVPQKFVHLDDYLVVNLLCFLEHLLSLPNLQLLGLHVIFGRDGSFGPSSLMEILQRSSQIVYSLGQLPALYIKSLLADET